MLQFMRGSEVVGYYNAGYKIVLLLTVVMGLLNSVFYPRFAATIKNFKEINSTQKFYAKLMSLLFLPIGLGGMVVAGPLIAFIYGESYEPAVGAFQILLMLPVITAISSVIAFPLIATGGERLYAKVVVLAALVNLMLNFVLIPQLGMYGAALATVAAEVTALVYLLATNQQFGSVLIRALARPLVASTLMALGVFWLTQQQVPLLLILAAGALLYGSLLVIIKEVTMQDMRALQGLLRRQE
jgi:O-antigen/teichoic acid export membrane protein